MTLPTSFLAVLPSSGVHVLVSDYSGPQWLTIFVPAEHISWSYYNYGDMIYFPDGLLPLFDVLSDPLWDESELNLVLSTLHFI